MLEQASRRAIVTGASRGIGAAVAERLAKDSFAVVVNFSKGADQAAAAGRTRRNRAGDVVPGGPRRRQDKRPGAAV